MAVQIPSIQRIAPQAPTSVGRIQTQLPDGAKAFAQTSAQLVQASQAVIKQVDKAERQSIDMQKIAMVNQYKLNRHKALTNLRPTKGDPTPGFHQYDLEGKVLIKDMMAAHSNSSPRAKDEFEKALRNADNSMQMQRYTLYGQMQDRYDQTNVDASVKDHSRSVTESVGLIRPGDESTLATVDAGLARMDNDRIGRSERLGSSTEVPEGYKTKSGELILDYQGKKYLIDDVTKNEMAKQGSETIYNSLNVLVSDGKSDSLKKAKYLFEKRSHRLDAVHKAKINTKFKKAEEDNNAVAMLSSMRDLTPDQVNTKLDKLSIKDPQLAFDVRKLRSANQGRRKNDRDRYSTKTYDRLMGELIKRSADGNPVLSTVELEAMPDFKESIDGVTKAHEKKAIYQFVTRPKESDPDVVIKMHAMSARKDFFKMSAQSMAKAMNGLNKKHFSYFFSLWERVKTESDAGERSKISFIRGEVLRQFKEKDLITGRGGKETKRSRQRREQFISRVMLEADKFPAGMSQTDMSNMIQKSVANQILEIKKAEDNVLTRWIREFRGEKPLEEPAPEAVVVPGKTKTTVKKRRSTSIYRSLSPARQREVRKQFKKDKGRRPKSLQEYEDFLSKRKK